MPEHPTVSRTYSEITCTTLLSTLSLRLSLTWEIAWTIVFWSVSYDQKASPMRSIGRFQRRDVVP